MMEALSRSLQPYKELVAQTASIVTIGQFFSGVFVCRDIYRKGTTKGTPATPFIGGVVIGMLMLQHGYILGDAAMIQVNVASIFLNFLYLAFYYQYSADKYEEILKPSGYGAVVAAVFLGYAQIESPENLEFRYGLVVTILMFALLASPLLDLKEILDKKDASAIPFPLVFMGTIVTFLWLLYGIILMNYFMIFQNVVGFALCLVQVVLIILYPGEGQSTKKKDNKKKD